MSLKKLGRYELIRVLGKGAMGLVYEGRDPNLDRRVAIKTIKVENLSEEAAAEYEARFRIEARSAARLQHPNIVSVYDSDRDGDIAFLVMEFITGEDLKHYLDKGDRYTLEQTQGIMGDLLSALDYAHQQGIVHRDIKPANLLIEKSGRVKLTDFGVARIQDSGEATRTQGTMVGTLKYMSPEQVQGRVIDSRADIFAAGIVLYQLLTGVRPFDGATDFAIIQQIVGHAPATPTAFNSGLPPAIDRVVAKSLAKSRDERYHTASEFAAALDAACRDAQDPTVVPPPSQQPGASHGTWTGTARPIEPLVSTQSGATGGLSTVTQELELVYWKDIKDSDDVADLELFVSKFPSGVYVDLARRRLKKLGVAIGEDSGSRAGLGMSGLASVPGQSVHASSGTGASTVLLPRSEISFEPTMRLAPAGLAAGSSAGSSHADETLPPSGWQAPAAALKSVMPAAPAGPGSVAAKSGVGNSDLDDDWHASDKPPLTRSANGRLRAQAADASSHQGAASPKQIAALAVAGLVLVASVVFGIQRLKAPAQPAAGQTVPVVMAATAAAPSTAASGALGVSSAAAMAAMPAPVAIPGPAIITETAAQAGEAASVKPAFPSGAVPVSMASSAPLAAASSRIDTRAARKAAQEKEKADKAARAVVGATPVAEPPEPEPPKRVVAAPAPAPAAPATPASPRQACEGRNFVSFELCVVEQCGKRAFSGHAICQERRAMDERRRESEQFRR